MEKYNLEKIENTFKEKSWWAIIFNLLPAKYITYFVANKTNITPNQITFISFIVAILAGEAFFKGYFILGAILYQLSFIFDIVDGALARVTNQSSKFGAFFDVFTDWIKAPLLFVIIFLKTNHYYSLIFLLLLLFWLCLANKYNDMLFYKGTKSISKNIAEKSFSEMNFIEKYFFYMKKNHIQPFPSTVEVEGFLLFLYPIFQKDVFIYLGFIILIFQLAIKLYIIIKKIK
ncbi:conserved hypothetical protein [Lebetimonas natsushimae]|uniref:CDP-alcohol phosphatidyltransferase family protein n=1 Tax=Lebetimonas natsushimae TaxID=1936991 RepID=A0A292YC08_9BACT|nr:CDP-alcohol phosphatidyltransferase family protein [Lebetimonas natsushimae]GAX86854.1 conserved hypothetical protein [Lebetimonas natsushimae]